jgi:hypothetical protein
VGRQQGFDGEQVFTLNDKFESVEECDTAEDRERVIREYGALEGGRETLARLADYVAKM